MSDSADNMSASILLADFANVDSAGKANIVGGGIRIIGTNPTTGQTAPLSVFVQLVSYMPSDGDNPAVEVLLATAAGDVVELNSPNGKTPLRVSQNVEFQVAKVPGITIPKGAIPAMAQVVLNFPAGIPLAAGNSYQWRVHVDHELLASYSIYVPAQPKGPVFG